MTETVETKMDTARILELIPHRPPMIMVDRILEIEPFKRVVGQKNVTADEPFFAGHFPGRPILPGVMMLESVAQTAAVLGFFSEPSHAGDKAGYLLGINRVRFRRVVVPGDVMRIEIDVLKIRGPIWKFTAQITVDGQTAVQGEFLASFAEEDK